MIEIQRLPRAVDWTRRLGAVIDRHAKQPFQWGVSDCAMWAEAVAAMTGYDPLHGGGTSYATAVGAHIALRRQGFTSVRSLVEARFRVIHPSAAMRGDIGYPAGDTETLMGPCVIDGAIAVSKSEAGWIAVPRDAIAVAFAV